MPFDDREQFARLIKCEAGGEGDNGMRAVATVVMNRANATTGEYQRVGQGSTRRIIEQPGQFACSVFRMPSGQVNPQSMWTNPPEQIHYDIADWAISGNRLNSVDNSLWFMNPRPQDCPFLFPKSGSGRYHSTVNQHCFFRPTVKYDET